MVNKVKILDKSGWFSEKGKDNGIVISSRVSLSRNLNGYKYPWRMNTDDKEKVNIKISNAINKIKKIENFGITNVCELSNNDKNILSERFLFKESFIQNPEMVLALSDDNLVSCMINETEHLDLSVRGSGLSILDCYKRINTIDRELEKELEYAVSIEYGYLNTKINNIGTGLQLCIMMHLPAIERIKQIEAFAFLIGDAIETALEVQKISLGNQKDYLSGIYLVLSKNAMGKTEENICENFEKAAQKLIEFEEYLRRSHLKIEPYRFVDFVDKSYKILVNARLIGLDEALKNLINLRFGVSLGIINIPIELCTSLIILSQKYHIMKMINKKKDSINQELIDYTRAAMIKNALEQIQI